MPLQPSTDSPRVPVILKAGEGDFSDLSAPARLFVPSPALAAGASLEIGTAGVLLTAGRPLTITQHRSAPVPLAPVEGRIIGEAAAHLTDGRAVRGIWFEPSVSQSGRALPGERPRDFLIDPPSPSQVLDAIRDLEPADLSQWIDRLRDAGVWANRWSSPDLLGQMNHCLRRPVDTIICNTLDSSTAMPLQRELAGAYPHELVAGAALLGKLTGARFVWMVLDEADALAISPFLKGVSATAGVSIVTVRNVYPQPHPTLLLHTLTRRKLRPGELPTAHGAMILDAAAAIAVGKVLLRNEAALAAPIAVFDATLGRSYLRWCPIGSSVRDVLANLDVISRNARFPKLYAGVPMRRIMVPEDAVVSVGGELTLNLSAESISPVRPDPCIRCGWCVEGCPVRIHPAGLLDAAQLEDRAMADHFGIDACIECGICSYVCPSHLPLLEGIRFLRESVMPLPTGRGASPKT